MQGVHPGPPQQQLDPYKAPPKRWLETMRTQPAETDGAHPKKVALPRKAPPAELEPAPKNWQPLVKPVIKAVPSIASRDAKWSQNASKVDAKGGIVLESPVHTTSEIPLHPLQKRPPDSPLKQTEPTTNYSASSK